MAKIEAKQDFYARQSRADNLHQNWLNFSQNYMENTLNKSMTEYLSMILDGLKQWFENKTSDARMIGDVDTNKIILLYRKDNSGNYQLEYTAENSVPSDFPQDGRYIVLKSDILPESYRWDIENYITNLESEIYGGIYRMILQKNYNAVETHNYSFPAKKISFDDIEEKTSNKTNSLIQYVGMGITVLFLGVVLFQLTRYRLRLKTKGE